MLRNYVGSQIVLGVRPEHIDINGDIDMDVTNNENLGQNTLVHGHIGKKHVVAKIRDWCNYKPGDKVQMKFTHVHFFDKQTTNAIR